MYNATVTDLSGSILHAATGDLLAVVDDLRGVVPTMFTYKKVWYEMQRVDGVFASFFQSDLSPSPVLVAIIWTEMRK